MKALFDFIKAKINTDLPEYKTVRVWRNQLVRANIDRDEGAFRYPACFVEFITTDYQNNAIGFRDVDLIVRFHFGFENYYLEKDLDLVALENFDAAMFRFRGNDLDPVHFTSFSKIVNSDLPDDDNVDEQIIEYITKYREMAGIKPTTTLKPVDLDLTAENL